MGDSGTMVRTGVVSAKNGKMVRCIFPDMDNMTSDWLYVLQCSDDEFVPDVNDRVVVLYPFGFNTDGFVLGVIP